MARKAVRSSPTADKNTNRENSADKASEAPVIPEEKEEALEQPPVGRPPIYEPKFAKEVEVLCERGATDEEIAAYFRVSVRTIYRWKLQHREFCQAIQSGKDFSDERVERSLYQRAIGYYYKEQQAVKMKTEHGEVIQYIEVEKFMPPDTAAQQFWLKNRRRQVWADIKQVEVGGPGDFSALTDEELMQRVLADAEALGLVQKPDEAPPIPLKALTKGNSTQH